MYDIVRFPFFLWRDLNIGYTLIHLEAEFCTVGLCYWKIHKGIICDIWVMVLLFKMCWGRKYLYEFQSRKNGTFLALILWPLLSGQTVPAMKLYSCEWTVPRYCCLALLSHVWRVIIWSKGSTLSFSFLFYLTQKCF